jgi:hypothetical protein
MTSPDVWHSRAPYVYLSVRHDIEGVAGIPGFKQNLAGLQVTIADTGQDLLDLLGRQVPHQVATRQQPDPFARVGFFCAPRHIRETR